MNAHSCRSLALSCLLMSGGILGAAAAESSLTITLDASKPGLAIPADFSGLSFEVSLLLPGANGVRYFRPDNLPLVRLFHTLGIKNLRVGGNTSDRDAKVLPGEADLDSFFGFARAAGVKVIYCLRLHNGDPGEDAKLAQYIMAHYAAQMDCFSIGQEPSAYPVERKDTRPNAERMGAAVEKYRYEQYRVEWKKFADVIVAAVPAVSFCGPGVHNNPEWARRFMDDFGHAQHVSLLTEHLYPGGAGGKVPSPEFGRDRMLSSDFVRAYQRLYDGFVPLALTNSLPYRLEEVNNYFNGGATNVSNTFASALWGLDFMYWWAEHRAAGVNFHTGDRVAAGSRLQPSKYTAFFSKTNGYEIRPLGYALKTFALGSGGGLLPLRISAQPEINCSAYAVRTPANTLLLTFINKEHSAGARDANVTLSGAGNCAGARILLLKAPGGDVAATSGITLGGAELGSDASWTGDWKPLAGPVAGAVKFAVPAASAAVVEVSLK